MLTAVIHLQGLVQQGFVAAEGIVDPGPGPIVPELKELVWGAGSFIVLAIAMRFYLFPRLKKGMDERYAGIRSDHETADAERAAARSEVADYEALLATVKAEGAARVDAARQQLESERQAQVAALNVQLAERRAVAQAQSDAARLAVRDQIEAAVADVAGRAGELATGRRPDAAVVAAVVTRVVNEVMAK